MDDRLYPQGKGGIKSRYNNAGVLVFYTAAGAEIFRIDPTLTGGYVIPGSLVNLRARFSIAQVNAGATILAAIAGFKFRMVSCTVISVGGAAGTVTTVDILATQAATGVKLVAYAQASLTRSTVLKDGGTGAAVLADGASYVANDVGTALTIGKTGSAVDTAVSVDVNLSYVIEP